MIISIDEKVLNHLSIIHDIKKYKRLEIGETFSKCKVSIKFYRLQLCVLKYETLFFGSEVSQ